MRDVCFYDGQCGLCRRSTAVLRRMDWLGRLDFQDMNAAPDLPVRFEQAMTGMPMRTASGKILIGFPAVRRALLQTPPGAPVAAILYIPGIAFIAQRIYTRIAASRARDACALPHSPPAGARDLPSPAHPPKRTPPATPASSL